MKFKEGDLVEVLKRNEVQNDSWFPAKIVVLHKEKYTVRYELFWTTEGKLVKETVNAEDVRPCQPSARGEDQWNVGQTVEVFDLHSWRVGSIAKVLKNDHVVARLFGSIQLKQFHTSNLRTRQTWQKNKWLSIDQVTGEKQLENCYDGSCENYAKDLDETEYQGLEEVRDQKSKGTHAGFISPVRKIRKNLIAHPGFLQSNTLKGTNRKGKASSRTVGFHPQTRRSLPRQANAVNSTKCAEAESFDLKSDKQKIITYSHTDAVQGYINNRSIYSSSAPARVIGEDNECSVASCSGNEIVRYRSIRKHYKGNADDAMSSWPSVSDEDDRGAPGDEFANIHELELHAYRSTIQALHASGPLSWEQESLLTNLRLCLNISNEEHLLHLRRLLST